MSLSDLSQSIECPNCTRAYEDFTRAIIDLEVELRPEDPSMCTCPTCDFEVPREVLTLGRDGVWRVGGREEDRGRLRNDAPPIRGDKLYVRLLTGLGDLFSWLAIKCYTAAEQSYSTKLPKS